MSTTKQTSATGIANQLGEQRRRVDFDSYDITVQQLTAMVESQQIDVAPTYQRRFRWDATRQSQLIESLFLGIPIPNIFMATNPDGTWEVVDGVQRLSTIAHFAGNDATRKALNLSSPLEISGLQKLDLLNGCKFSELPPSVQLQFMLRPMKVTTLNDKSDLSVRFDLFERLNTGGLRLTDQEIRGCIFRGPFNDFLEKLSDNLDFRRVVHLRNTMEADGTRDEYVLRFFSFLHNYKQFDHSVVGFLNNYMASAVKSFDYAAGESIFANTFAALAKAFPNGLARRSGLTPVNLYEAVAVGAAIALRQRKKLDLSSGTSWVSSTELRKLTTGATNSRKMVVGRIELAARNFGAK